MDPLSFVRAGDRVRPSAETQNELLAAARASRTTANFGVPTLEQPDSQIIVKAHDDLPRHAPICVSESSVPVKGGQFRHMPAFKSRGGGVDANSPFAVTTEKIPKGRYGTAAISGILVVRIRMYSQDHRHATFGPENILASGAIGYAAIMWNSPKEDAQENELYDDESWLAWAIILLGQTLPSLPSCWDVSISGGVATTTNNILTAGVRIFAASGNLSVGIPDSGDIWLCAQLNTETNALSLVAMSELPTFNPESELVHSPLYLVRDGGVVVDYRTMPRLPINT